VTNNSAATALFSRKLAHQAPHQTEPATVRAFSCPSVDFQPLNGIVSTTTPSATTPQHTQNTNTRLSAKELFTRHGQFRYNRESSTNAVQTMRIILI
jgi:hypothetical protein